MPTLAIALVLSGAILHAVWNMLVRRAADPEAFAWWLGAAAAVVYAPLGVYLLLQEGVPTQGWPFVVASSAIHAAYFALLGRAYRYGDLAIVYPIARGTGPLLVPALAVPLLGERLSPLGAAGIGLIVVGVVTLQSGGFRLAALKSLTEAFHHPAALYALATGVTIALYSVNDKVGVHWVHPVLYAWLFFLGSAVIAGPYFWLARRGTTVTCWRADRRAILVAATVAPSTYILALLAFQLGPVSYLAPMRELSIVVAALLGGIALREPMPPARLVSVGLTAVGVGAIGLGA